MKAVELNNLNLDGIIWGLFLFPGRSHKKGKQRCTFDVVLINIQSPFNYCLTN